MSLHTYFYTLECKFSPTQQLEAHQTYNAACEFLVVAGWSGQGRG